jgi:hypothetical protein
VSVRVHIRPGAFDEIAKSDGMKDALEEAGEAVKDNVDRMGIRVEHEPGDIALPVEVDEGFVSIAHPSGLFVQAKHGALTKAAAEAGLKVGGS